jgi:pseudouridine-5'-phosphate glycosidase
MMNKYPENMIIQPLVVDALQHNQPVVALESAVITHGLPQPVNLETALEMQKIILDQGGIPATIALLDGKVHVGLDDDELEKLAFLRGTRKISQRDFGYAIVNKLSGGTTVAGTMAVAHIVGIKVFATGGIGGVHRDAPFDISADLQQLSKTPMIVVCAGAKAILDLRATIEVLETNGVLIIGYQTDEFPAFYSRSSGLVLDSRMDTPGEIASIAKSQWEMGEKAALLVVQPPPGENEIPSADIERSISEAVAEAKSKGIRGPAVTPFLLDRVKTLTGGKSMEVNLSLLKNNAKLAAQIAIAFQSSHKNRM